MKVRKRPVVIEAWEWTFSEEQEEPPVWVTDALGRWPGENSLDFRPEHPSGPHLVVRTLEGEMRCDPGSVLLQGVRGELYPCRADIFALTYERVEEP